MSLEAKDTSVNVEPVSTQEPSCDMVKQHADTSIAPLSTVDPEKTASQPATKQAFTAHSPSRQRLILVLATAAGFFAPLCGAVYLPSLLLFQDIFDTTGNVINASVSVYMAIFAVAPMFGAAASDYGGRKTVYLVTLAVFIVANTLLAAVPPTVGGLFVLRIFQALGASVVTSIGAGTVADITEPSKRAYRMGIFLLGPNLGPVLGPLIGGQFSQPDRWRWIFGFLSIAAFPVYVGILFLLPETLRCLVGNGSVYNESTSKSHIAWLLRPRFRQVQVVPDGAYPKPPRPTPRALLRLLGFVPNLIVSVACALQFSGLYCMYISFPHVWQGNYGWSGSQTGYAYLAPAICLLVSSLLVGRLSDWQYRRAESKSSRGSSGDASASGKSPNPERRIDVQIWGYIIAAAGKAMFGWFVTAHLSPAAGLAAAGIAATGTGLVMVTSTVYQTECQPTAAAMLVALSGLLRNLGSAIAAALIDSLVSAMGYNWCFTGLAIVDALCVVGVTYVRFKGDSYRMALARD